MGLTIYSSTGLPKTAASTGEANTASNAGTGGIGIVLTKSGVDLPFKSIAAASSKITVADDVGNSNVDIDVDPSQIATSALNNDAGWNAYSHPNHTGDVTSVGDGAQTIADDAVTNAKMANMAANTLKANATAGATDPADLAVGTNSVVGRVAGNIVAAQLATDQVANNAISLGKLADISTASLLGRVTAATGDPEVLTGTQATTLLDVFTTSTKGLAPGSGGGTTNFLRADGTWAAPPGGTEVNDLATDGIAGIADNQLAVGTGAGTAGYQTLPASGAVAFNGTAFAQANFSDLGTKTHTHADAANGGTLGTSALDNDAVTYAKIQNVVGNNVFLGNNSGAGAVVDELTGTEATALLDAFTSALKGLAPASGGGTTNYLRADGTWAVPPGSGGSPHNLLDGSTHPDTTAGTVARGDLITGQTATPSWTRLALGGANTVLKSDGTDVTWGSIATANISDNQVTYAKLQDVTATSRFLGRITAGAGDPEELTGTQATTLLDAFTSGLKGLAPASGGGTTNFLRADGTWAAPGGSGGTLDQAYDFGGAGAGRTITADSNAVRIAATSLGGDDLLDIDHTASGTLTANSTDVVTLLSDRTHTAATSVTDDFNVLTITRNIDNTNASGTLIANGSLLRLVTQRVQTAGTATFNAALIELEHDSDVAASAPFIEARRTGDTGTRLRIDNNGTVTLGSGTGGEASLTYSSNGVLGVSAIVNAVTGFQILGAAATGNVLRGNGTNFVSATLASTDLSDSSSLATLTGTQTLTNKTLTLPIISLDQTLASNGQITIDSTNGWWEYRSGGTNYALGPQITKGAAILSPQTADECFVYFTEYAITIEELQAAGRGGTSVAWELRFDTDGDNAGTLIDGNTTTTDGTLYQYGTLTTSAVPAGRLIWLECDTVTGTVADFAVQMRFRRDPA